MRCYTIVAVLDYGMGDGHEEWNTAFVVADSLIDAIEHVENDCRDNSNLVDWSIRSVDLVGEVTLTKMIMDMFLPPTERSGRPIDLE